VQEQTQAQGRPGNISPQGTTERVGQDEQKVFRLGAANDLLELSHALITMIDSDDWQGLRSVEKMSVLGCVPELCLPFMPI